MKNRRQVFFWGMAGLLFFCINFQPQVIRSGITLGDCFIAMVLFLIAAEISGEKKA